MANYVFAYSGGKGVAADEAERNVQMAKWGQWFEELGSAVDVYEAIRDLAGAPVPRGPGRVPAVHEGVCAHGAGAVNSPSI